MTNVYGGDEVGAVVMDIGHYSSKVGYAGEDSPRSEISTIVAVHDAPTKLETELDRFESTQTGGAPPNRERKYYIDTTKIMVPRTGQEIKTFLRDGIIEDWDLFEKMIEYIYANHVHSEPTLHPLMFSEACWNTKNAREKLVEIMFEKYNIPAIYLGKNAMLCAFSTGRPTALVFDSGAHHTSAIPVLEGHVLNKGIVKTSYGGDYITGFCYKQLMEKGVEINPYYLVKSKEPVEAGQPANWTRRTNLPEGITPSWHNYMVREEVRNYKHSVVRVFEAEYDRDEAASDLTKIHGREQTAHYHFPDGYNLDLSVDDQFQIVEQFFDTNFKLGASSSSSDVPPATPVTPGLTTSGLANLRPPTVAYPDIVLQSVAKCDIDIRPSLLSSILLVGGNTLLPGFTDRMINSLPDKAPQNLKVKVIPNNSPVERKYAAWIGGSILASLGTFQQLWISKLEYEEVGKSCIDSDCH